VVSWLFDERELVRNVTRIITRFIRIIHNPYRSQWNLLTDGRFPNKEKCGLDGSSIWLSAEMLQVPKPQVQIQVLKTNYQAQVLALALWYEYSDTTSHQMIV